MSSTPTFSRLLIFPFFTLMVILYHILFGLFGLVDGCVRTADTGTATTLPPVVTTTVAGTTVVPTTTTTLGTTTTTAGNHYQGNYAGLSLLFWIPLELFRMSMPP